MSAYIIVLNTAPSLRIARKIAQTLIKEGLAACVNIIPQVRSYYKWQGKLYNEPEVMLLIKTTRPRFRSLHNRIKELHPYQVPEIVSLNISAGSKDYLAWIKSLTKQRDFG